jgi:DNA-binding HxlR family transcriptional regulator
MKKKEPVILDAACVREDELIGAMDTIAVLSGKWRIQLITTLNCGGALQFMEVLRLLDGIGPKMLSKELQDLEANHIVARTVMDTKPVTVKYELTPHGQTLERIINEMRLWGRAHRKEVIGR